MHNNDTRAFLALVVIGAALCLMTYHQVRVLAWENPTNAYQFLSRPLNIEAPPMKTAFGPMYLEDNWKPRLLSNLLGGWLTRDCFDGKNIHADAFANKASLYAALWMALCFLAYLITLRGGALVPLLGTYCGVAFGYMPDLTDKIYPWDMPALFFYTVFVCLVLRRRLAWLLPLLPLAVMFKETAALLPLAFLFVPGPRGRRLGLCVLGLGLAGAAKLLANHLTHAGGHSPFNGQLFLANLRFIFLGGFPHLKEWYRIDYGWFNHPVFINAGLLTGFFFVARWRDPNVRMFGALIGLFTLCTLFCGVVFEYRIWFELIPLCLYPFYVSPAAAGPVPPEGGPDAGPQAPPPASLPSS